MQPPKAAFSARRGGIELRTEKDLLQEAFTQAGACAWGCLRAEEILPRLNGEQQARLRERMSTFAALLCAAFPYGGAEAAKRISRYAWGEDYHAVLARRLAQAGARLQEEGLIGQYACWSDLSPFPEVLCAAMAGLGKLGENGLLLTREAGSYVFLGFLTVDRPLSSTKGETASCRSCGACRRACPGGAISREGFRPERCLSALTQQRGVLTAEQEALLQAGGLIWGCDRCQIVCPENRSRTAQPLPEFSAEEPQLTGEDLALSDRVFRRRFAGRAFAWRGVQPLRRNAALLQKKKEHPKGEEI